ncbi:usg protein [Aestuariivirga sp.]|uniref:usg protein n=1 Tax=Aestuariivirga sp. TaxID=2650926 RepID=UPI0039E2B770
MIDRDFSSQLRGLDLTTAEIMYHMPDFHRILQTFIWQDYDLAPKFPKLIKFLDFWSHNLEGTLASVRVAHSGILRPVELRHVGQEWSLH